MQAFVHKDLKRSGQLFPFVFRQIFNIIQSSGTSYKRSTHEFYIRSKPAEYFQK